MLLSWNVNVMLAVSLVPTLLSNNLCKVCVYVLYMWVVISLKFVINNKWPIHTKHMCSVIQGYMTIN